MEKELKTTAMLKNIGNMKTGNAIRQLETISYANLIGARLVLLILYVSWIGHL